jgi:2-methylcitrate dehydratase PrpD
VSDLREAYTAALLDWLGCAVAGWGEPASLAARSLGEGLHERILAVATAGHVLDFDDTFLPGLSHLSAPTAPSALLLAAELGTSVGDALDAYAAGFEAMAAVARASHPELYMAGWHPTAVCGGVGAATAASRLLGLDSERERSAVAIALLRAGGLRAAFGSDGKSLQVGMAAASGVLAARLAEAGASASLEQAARGTAGFERAFQASFGEGPEPQPAVLQNWIKAWPCCLQTHGSIEAATLARADGYQVGEPVEVAVHPISLEAAAFGPRPADGLQAKFSIPYCTAFTLLHGPPGLAAFRAVRPAVTELAERIKVRADDGLTESAAVLSAGGRQVRVEAALGSPHQPMSQPALAAKLSAIAGDRLVGALDDPGRPAESVLAAAGIG